MAEYKGVPTNQWLIPEDSPEIQTRIGKANVVAALARRVRMSTKQKRMKRSAPRYPQFLSGGGGQTAAYPIERRHGDVVTMTAEKMGDRVFYDEDDLADVDADLISADVTEIRVKANKMRSRAMIGTDIGKPGYPNIVGDSDLGIGAPYESLLNVLKYGRNGQGTYDPPLGRLGHVILPGTAGTSTHLATGFPTTTAKWAGITTTANGNSAAGLRDGNYMYELLSEMKRPVDESDYFEQENMAYVFDNRFINLFENTTDKDGRPLLGTVQNGAFRVILDRPVFFQDGMSWAPSGWQEVDYYLFSGMGAFASAKTPSNRVGQVGEIAIQWANANLSPADELVVWVKEKDDTEPSGKWTKQTLITTTNDVAKGKFFSGAARPTETLIASTATDANHAIKNGNGTGGDVSVGAYFVDTDDMNLSRWRGKASLGGVHDIKTKTALGVYGNWKELIAGDRMGEEFMLSTPRAHDDFDTVALKARERQGCVVRQPSAFCMTAIQFT